MNGLLSLLDGVDAYFDAMVHDSGTAGVDSGSSALFKTFQESSL